MKTNSKILATMALGFGIALAAPTLANAKATDALQTTTASAAKIELAGYYTYQPTCWREIVDYDFYGRPIWARICG